MKITFTLSILLSVIFAVSFSPSFQQTPDWSYDGKDNGPAKWGENPNYPECLVKNNKEQSPINIVKKDAKKGSEKSTVGNVLKTRRANYKVKFVDNGVHFDCKTPGTCGTLTVDQTVYRLEQFHFHTHSEHEINGKTKAFEIHMVHTSSNGKEAVFGVLARKGSKKIDLSTPIAAITSKKDFEFDLGKVVKKKSGYFKYIGGLTTPGCDGGVQWIVQKSVKSMPKSQVNEFLNLVGPPKRGNWRPVQPLSGRTVELFQG